MSATAPEVGGEPETTDTEPVRPVATARTRTEEVRAPVAGLGLVAVLTVLVGAWGGIVPFAGPSIGFNADASAPWHWGLVHALLWAAPGALAVVFGLILLAVAAEDAYRFAEPGPEEAVRPEDARAGVRDRMAKAHFKRE